MPFFINRQLEPIQRKRLMTGRGRTFEIFDYLLNGVVLSSESHISSADGGISRSSSSIGDGKVF